MAMFVLDILPLQKNLYVIIEELQFSFDHELMVFNVSIQSGQYVMLDLLTADFGAKSQISLNVDLKSTAQLRMHLFIHTHEIDQISVLRVNRLTNEGRKMYKMAEYGYKTKDSTWINADWNKVDICLPIGSYVVQFDAVVGLPKSTSFAFDNLVIHENIECVPGK